MRIEELQIAITGYPGLVTNSFIVESTSHPGQVVVIDPAENAPAILKHIGERDLVAILLTHRHNDHVLGTPGLVAAAAAAGQGGKYGIPVYIHKADLQAAKEEMLAAGSARADVDAINFQLVDEGDRIDVLGQPVFQVLHTPGHSSGSISFYVPEEHALFDGDTLFQGTCGAMEYESGSVAEMHDSLQRLRTLPPDTVVYCGHDNLTTIGAEQNRGLIEV
jgi:glyoxylase-like metal-dependent hydrolase (beta-lactamase superfamily II)